MSEQITIGEFITLGALLGQLTELQTQLAVITEKTKKQLDQLSKKTVTSEALQDVQLSLIGLTSANIRVETSVDTFAARVLGGDENAR